MTQRLDDTACVQVYTTIFNDDDRNCEFDCTIQITLPSDVWVSHVGARKIAAELLMAADEVEAELRRRGELGK